MLCSTASISCCAAALPSNRYHRSNDDCLEDKRENYQVCSVQYCVQQLCTVQCTHKNRPNSCVFVRFSFSVVILCVSLSMLDLAFWDYFVL